MQNIVYIKQPQGIFVRKGKNTGKKIGMVFFPKNEPSYLLIDKQLQEKQLFFKPELREYCWLSKTAIADCLNLKVEKIIYHIIGYERNSFYIVFNLKEFLDSQIVIGYDDPQKGVLFLNKPKHYEFPRGLYQYVSTN